MNKNSIEFDYDLNEEGKYESECFDESGYRGSLYLYPNESHEEAIRREITEAGISVGDITDEQAFELYMENYGVITEKYN